MGNEEKNLGSEMIGRVKLREAEAHVRASPRTGLANLFQSLTKAENVWTLWTES